MILLSLATAWGGPVLGPPLDPLEACLESAGPPRATAAPEGTDRVALVVGIPCHRDPRVASLGLANDDAVRFGQALEARGYAVAYRTTLVDRQELLDALDEAASAVGPEGELVLYLSGHGVLRQGDDALERFLVTSDTRLADLEGTALRVEDLEHRLADAEVARTLFVSDTCFAAQPVLAPTDGFTRRGLPLARLPGPPGPGDLRLYAARFFEEAVESTELGGGLYTHHLLAALDDPAADLDGNACVDALEAHVHARPAVEAARAGFQHPVADWSHLPEVRGTLGCRSPGDRAVIGAPDRLEARVDGSDSPVLAAVAPGRHEVQLGTTERRARLDATPGAWLDVREAAAARRPHAELRLGPSATAHPGLPDLGIDAIARWSLPFLAGPEGFVDVSGRWLPRQGDPTAPCLAWSGGAAHVTTGLQVGRRATVGPLVGLGTYRRSAHNTCTADDLAAGWGTSLRAGAEAGLPLSPALRLVLDGGVDGVWFAHGVTELEAVPWARLGLAYRP